MKNLQLLIAIPWICIGVSSSAQIRKEVGEFDKVIISPYIQATLVEGEKEQVTIDNITVDESKLHIEVNNNTLRIYLDGAKDIPKNEKDYSKGYKQKRPLYNGTVVKATISYKKLSDLSVRGEETQLCQSPIKGDKLRLRIYGESEVILNEVNLAELQATIYGESILEIKSGVIKLQKYTAYGESEINSLSITGNTSQITAYGESNFKVNVADRIRITSFGESKLQYKGDPELVKGLQIGELHIEKLN